MVIPREVRKEEKSVRSAVGVEGKMPRKRRESELGASREWSGCEFEEKGVTAATLGVGSVLPCGAKVVSRVALALATPSALHLCDLDFADFDGFDGFVVSSPASSPDSSSHSRTCVCSLITSMIVQLPSRSRK